MQFKSVCGNKNLVFLKVINKCQHLNLRLIVFSRWVRFEETVEHGGNRWSKPHVGSMSLHYVFELREIIKNCSICLDMNARSVVSTSANYNKEETLYFENKYNLNIFKQNISLYSWARMSPTHWEKVYGFIW